MYIAGYNWGQKGRPPDDLDTDLPDAFVQGVHDGYGDWRSKMDDMPKPKKADVKLGLDPYDSYLGPKTDPTQDILDREYRLMQELARQMRERDAQRGATCMHQWEWSMGSQFCTECGAKRDVRPKLDRNPKLDDEPFYDPLDDPFSFR
jgi:hypothetical protein